MINYFYFFLVIFLVRRGTWNLPSVLKTNWTFQFYLISSLKVLNLNYVIFWQDWASGFSHYRTLRIPKTNLVMFSWKVNNKVGYLCRHGFFVVTVWTLEDFCKMFCLFCSKLTPFILFKRYKFSIYTRKKPCI